VGAGAHARIARVLRTVTIRAAPILAALVLLAGCGNSRTPAPNLLLPATPDGFHALGYPKAGVALLAPRNWAVLSPKAPLVTVFSSGPAVVALWRFASSSPSPTGRPALEQALTALLAAARHRDPGLRLIRSGILTIDHHSAVELDAFEQIAGSPRRVRSVHVYVPGAELVLEEYAPAAMFHAVDHAVFSPVRRSLELIPMSS
jgi:hypothetical protein